MTMLSMVGRDGEGNDADDDADDEGYGDDDGGDDVDGDAGMWVSAAVMPMSVRAIMRDCVCTDGVAILTSGRPRHI